MALASIPLAIAARVNQTRRPAGCCWRGRALPKRKPSPKIKPSPKSKAWTDHLPAALIDSIELAQRIGVRAGGKRTTRLRIRANGCYSPTIAGSRSVDHWRPADGPLAATKGPAEVRASLFGLKRSGFLASARCCLAACTPVSKAFGLFCRLARPSHHTALVRDE